MYHIEPRRFCETSKRPRTTQFSSDVSKRNLTDRGLEGDEDAEDKIAGPL